MFLLRAGDNKEIVAAELFDGFDKGVEFAVAGFLGSHVITDLNQLLYFCAFTDHEIYLFMIACAVIKQCLPGDVASAQEFYKDLIFQQSAEVLSQIERRALYKAVIYNIYLFRGFVHHFQLIVEAWQIEKQVWLVDINAISLWSDPGRARTHDPMPL